MRPILSIAIFTVGLVGCGAAEMTFGEEEGGIGSFLDSDNDGLSDDEEIELVPSVRPVAGAAEPNELQAHLEDERP